MLQGHRQAEIGSAVVQNPFFSRAHEVGFTNPTHTVAAINVKESAVASLAARGVIEGHQIEAATRFRAHFEALSGLRSPSLREHVDGGKGREPFTDRQAAAGQELRKARQLLGARGFALIVLVAGEGRHLSEFCKSPRERLTCADCLRALLDDLSWLWGYSR